MNIAVLIKAVPRNRDSELNPDFTVQRTGKKMEINKSDLYAMEEALRIREKTGGKITAVSMGGKSSLNVLRYAISMGADEGILLSDDKFRGSDSYATSLVLSEAIRKNGADLVICGKRSSDGSTSQVPVETAVMLGYDFSVNAVKCEIAENFIICTERSEHCEISRRLGFPALISVENDINTPRLPDVKGILRSSEQEIKILSGTDLGITPDKCGINGSLTRVVSTERVTSLIRRNGSIISDRAEVVRSLKQELEKAAGASGDNKDNEKISYDFSSFGSNGVMVVCECRDGIISEESRYVLEKAVHAAAALETGISAVVPRCDVEAAGAQLACLGVRKIYRIDTEDFLTADIRTAAKLIIDAAESENVRTLLLPSTVCGMKLAPCIAAMTHSGLTADCIGIWAEDGKLYQKRPAFGGKVNAVIISQNSGFEMATVKPFADKPENYEVKQTPAEFIECGSCETVCESIPCEMTSLDQNIIVGIGAGVSDKADLEFIGQWCAERGYGIAATRRAVDTGSMPVSAQVGLTGRVISPELYIAIGISGAVEHIVGVSNAKRIISVNPSDSADLTEVSDIVYGINSKEFIDILRDIAES